MAQALELPSEEVVGRSPEAIVVAPVSQNQDMVEPPPEPDTVVPVDALSTQAQPSSWAPDGPEDA